MSGIYLLSDAHFKDAARVHAMLQEHVGQRCEVVSTPEPETLLTALKQNRQAVVVLQENTPERLSPLIQRCRSVLPSTAFVCLVDETASDPVAFLEADCHCLRQPADSFGLLAVLSSAMRQSELLSVLSAGAQVDEATNLYNQRYFRQRLGEEISLSKRHLSPLCCVILGINFYQMYLDTYGYDFINALFRYLGETISGMVRHEDIMARLGDEEIAILLPRSTEKGTKVFTNRLILNVSETVFKYGDIEESISICAGIAGYPPESADNLEKADADTVIRYAHHALHQARFSTADHLRVQLFSEISPAL